ncbi:MAG TPA: hypothetical protein VF101_11970, partial [Gaiellaceae bacterium]
QAGAAGRPRWGPLDRPLETADGYLAVAVDGDEMRRRFEAICGRAGARLRSRSAAEWELLLLDAGVPAAAVREDLAALPCDPLLGAHLEPLDAQVAVPAAPWRLS